MRRWTAFLVSVITIGLSVQLHAAIRNILSDARDSKSWFTRNDPNVEKPSRMVRFSIADNFVRSTQNNPERNRIFAQPPWVSSFIAGNFEGVDRRLLNTYFEDAFRVWAILEDDISKVLNCTAGLFDLSSSCNDRTCLDNIWNGKQAGIEGGRIALVGAAQEHVECRTHGIEPIKTKLRNRPFYVDPRSRGFDERSISYVRLPARLAVASSSEKGGDNGDYCYTNIYSETIFPGKLLIRSMLFIAGMAVMAYGLAGRLRPGIAWMIFGALVAIVSGASLLPL